MTAWTNLSFNFGAVLTSSQMNQLQANFTALAGAASGAPKLTLDYLTSSLSANVALNNTAIYFNGPIVAQGAVGRWLAIAQVTVNDLTAAATILAKLTDGVTTYSSVSVIYAVGQYTTITLAGVFQNPPANISMQVRDLSTTGGAILWNQTGSGKDSTMVAIRIG